MGSNREKFNIANAILVKLPCLISPFDGAIVFSSTVPPT